MVHCGENNVIWLRIVKQWIISDTQTTETEGLAFLWV